jgi:outer membrane autotransporter protein
VSAGGLRGSAQSIPGNVSLVSGTELIFDQAADATKTGNISGDGELTKLGAGTLTLAGTNTYTGGTTLAAGGLRGSTSAIQGDITNSGALILDQNTDGALIALVSGTGTLEKTGAGTVRIAQSQTYTGATTVTGGALELVSANLASDVSVSGGAALRGAGAIGDLDTAGRIAPSAASGFGTLSATSANFASGSRFDVRVAAGAGNDLLASSGNVVIQPGAALDLEPLAGSYTAPVSFDILTGASVTGNFTELPQFAFLTLMLANPGDGRITATLQASGASPAAFAQTPNQRAVAQALETVQPTATGDMAAVLDELVLLTDDEVPAALDGLSGEIIADFDHSRIALTRRLQGAIDARVTHLRSTAPGGPARERARLRSSSASRSRARDPRAPVGAAPRARRAGAWLTGIGATGDIEGESGASDYDYLLGGGLFGFDFELGRRGVAGATLGYSYADLELSGVPGDGTDQAYLAALYAAYTASRFQLHAMTHFAHHELESERAIEFQSISRLAEADFDGDDFGVSLAGSARIARIGAFQLEPVASLSWGRYERGSFGESGAGAISLEIDDETIDSLLGGLGLRAHARFPVSETTWFSPELFANWLHEFGDDEREFRARFAGASVDAPFTILGAEVDRDSLLGGFRLMSVSTQGASAELSYTALWNQQQLEHALSLGFQLVW